MERATKANHEDWRITRVLLFVAFASISSGCLQDHSDSKDVSADESGKTKLPSATYSPPPATLPATPTTTVMLTATEFGTS